MLLNILVQPALRSNTLELSRAKHLEFTLKIKCKKKVSTEEKKKKIHP